MTKILFLKEQSIFLLKQKNVMQQLVFLLGRILCELLLHGKY